MPQTFIAPAHGCFHPRETQSRAYGNSVVHPVRSASCTASSAQARAAAQRPAANRTGASRGARTAGDRQPRPSWPCRAHLHQDVQGTRHIVVDEAAEGHDKGRHFRGQVITHRRRNDPAIHGGALCLVEFCRRRSPATHWSPAPERIDRARVEWATRRGPCAIANSAVLRSAEGNAGQRGTPPYIMAALGRPFRRHLRPSAARHRDLGPVDLATCRIGSAQMIGCGDGRFIERGIWRSLAEECRPLLR